MAVQVGNMPPTVNPHICSGTGNLGNLDNLASHGELSQRPADACRSPRALRPGLGRHPRNACELQSSSRSHPHHVQPCAQRCPAMTRRSRPRTPAIHCLARGRRAQGTRWIFRHRQFTVDSRSYARCPFDWRPNAGWRRNRGARKGARWRIANQAAQKGRACCWDWSTRNT